MTRLAVVDDDPTGAQSEAGVPLLLEWPAAALRGRETFGAVHLLTNSRALDERAAYGVVRDAAAAAHAEMRERTVVLRGDSTLRGHLLAEYRRSEGDGEPAKPNGECARFHCFLPGDLSLCEEMAPRVNPRIKSGGEPPDQARRMRVCDKSTAKAMRCQPVPMFWSIT